jgi:hypothetical protein
MANEFILEYTEIDRERCSGVALSEDTNVCHGLSLNFDTTSEEQIICDMTKCPLLAKIAIGELDD